MKKIAVCVAVLAAAVVFATGAAGASRVSYHSGDVRALRALVAQFGLDADSSSAESMTYGKRGGFVEWSSSSPKRVRALRLSGRKAVGRLDAAPFAALREIYCEGSGITDLDLSQNVLLEKLYCSYNMIGSIDVSANAALRVIDARYCGLKELLLSDRARITKITCDHNALSELDLSGCLYLEELDCMFNLMSSIDTSENKRLKVLYWDGM